MRQTDTDRQTKRQTDRQRQRDTDRDKGSGEIETDSICMYLFISRILHAR